jgi:hypothetical protein
MTVHDPLELSPLIRAGKQAYTRLPVAALTEGGII